jgi:transforming growth factor-beta-induced protein
MYPIESARLITATVILLFAGTVTLTGCDQTTAPVEPNILEIMQQIPELSVVTGLLTEAELAETVATEGSITLFAPINAAFDEVDMTEISAADLRSILRYHVATTALPSWELTDGRVLATLQQENITVTIANNQGFVQDIQIIAVDGFGSNGVIHVINGIMMPPSLTDDNDDDDDE